MCVCVCVWWPERPVCRPGCAAGPPLCWEASGGEIPRCALAADSLPLPPRVVSRPSPSRWRARPPPPPPPVLWHWCHVAAPPPAPSVPLSVRPPASFRSPSAAPRGRALVCLASPGLPRPRSVACFAAAACPPTSSRAGRGGSTGGPPPSPPSIRPRRAPRSDALSRARVGPPGLPPAGRPPCPRRPASPAPLGWADGRALEGASAAPPRCGLVPVGPRPGSRGRRGGRARDGGVGCGGGGRGPAAPLPSFLHAVAAGVLCPSWT